MAGIYRCDSYVAENTKLSLVGVGMPRSWEFKDYTGAFYLEQGTSIKDILSDRAKRIELEYFRWGIHLDRKFSQTEGYDVKNVQKVEDSKR